MKTYVALVIGMMVLAVVPALRAQQCYTPVTSWKEPIQESYTLSANSGGSIPCTVGTCTMNQAAAGDLHLFLAGLNCSDPHVFWQSTDTITSATVQDTSSTDCSPFPPLNFTLTGTGGAASTSQLLIYPSSGTYTFAPTPGESATETWSGCNGNPGQAGVSYPLYPVGTWPHTFSIPSTVQPVTSSTNFTQPTQFDGGTNVPWTFNFTLDPKYFPDDDCKQAGGAGFPASSSIGCQNQSLGEDVPIVGTGFDLHYESDRASGAGADSAATGDASMIGGWTLSVHHAYDVATNTLFLGDGTQRNGYQLGALVMFNNNALFTSATGDEVYVFARTPQGAAQHVQTLRPLTGALEYQFGYDSAGQLVTVTDGSGNVTTIQRNASEQPTAIVAPFGQTTTLGLDGNGFLSQVTDPLGKSVTFVNSSTGLLMSRTDGNGNMSNYTYDGGGGLATDADSVGGSIALTRTDANSGLGWTVAQTTSMGRTSSFQNTLTVPWVEDVTSTHTEQQSITWPSGLQATKSISLQNGKIAKLFTLPDGTSNSATLTPDPVWGIQAPVGTSETISRGNLTMNITGSRSTTLGTAGNPFTVASETDTVKINGRTYTSVFTGSSKTYVDTTPVKRKTTTVLDSLERISSIQVGALLPVVLAYDSKGRLSTITQGTRTSTLTYDANGFLASTTDPMNLTHSFTRDADGYLLTTTLPDGRVIGYSHDANGNVTSVTPPGKSAHDFSYTAVDLTSAYMPPTVPGTGTTNYAYNADRDPTTITRPDGQTIQFGYDSAGRLSSTTTPTENITYAYDSTTGNLNSASITGGEALAYGYNGPLPTSSTLTGTVAGTVSRAYNNNFWIASESIDGGNTVNLTYDNDGLLTKSGSLTLKRDPKDGLVTGTTLGSATDTLKYSTFGELTGYTAKYSTTTLDSVTYTRDADGRISTRTETIGGKKNTFTYIYDTARRLTGVKQNGTTVSTYTYDTNSNRLTGTTSSGTVTGTYDAQDRLLTYGNASYTYTANGELASQTVGSQTTTYTYDVAGNLTGVSLPNGTKISYILDPEDHRVGKQVNGAVASGFLYDDDAIVAQLDSSNNVVSGFIYATNSTVPDYMVNGGVTYRVISDQLGSPRLVVNTSTGAITERIDYDEFGNVINDTNPGFQPFGFAGGLYDQDTKLVRFGARDYNPSIGRWTAKDPWLFNGGDTELYGYVFADPVNLTDPSGLDPDCKNSKKKKLKKAVDKIAHKITGDKITVGPVDVHIDRPAISAGVSVGVEVDGVKVADATAEVEVGIKVPETEGAPPKGDMFYVNVEGNLVVLGHEFNVGHWHAEGGDPNNMPVPQLVHSRVQQIDQSYCPNGGDCQNQ
jgi:RHS repeat-associated protein